MRDFGLLLKHPKLCFFGINYTVLKSYKLNIFNTRKISTEQTITLAAVFGAAKYFIAVEFLIKLK